MKPREFQALKYKIKKDHEEKYRKTEDGVWRCNTCDEVTKKPEIEFRVRKSTDDGGSKIETRTLEIRYCPNCEKEPETSG